MALDGPIRLGIATNLILHDDKVMGKAAVQYKRFKYTKSVHPLCIFKHLFTDNDSGAWINNNNVSN